MLSILVATAASTELSDGISLLQTQARIHDREDAFVSLPDPKKKSSLTDGTADVRVTTEFLCAGGKGKWVKTTTHPTPGGLADLSTSTQDIGGMTAPMNYFPNGRVQDGGEKLMTEHGAVKSAEACFARARIDFICNHYAEDVTYLKHAMNQPHTGIGVWYNPQGQVDNLEGGVCYCGRPHGLDLNLVDANADGVWYCRLDPEDFEGVTDQTPTDLAEEAKEKKTPEQRETCKKAKAKAKSSKGALKALRKKLKAQRVQLKAEIKAAKETFLQDKGARDASC